MVQRILVVEDSRTVRRVVERTLSSAGFLVDLAQDANEALEKVADHVPDLVLLDFVLPGLNGLQLCQRFATSDNLKDVPVVLISAKSDKIGPGFLEQSGAVDAVQKPFSSEALLTTITHALARVQAKQRETDDRPSSDTRSSVAGLLVPQDLEHAELERERMADQVLERLVKSFGPEAPFDKSALKLALVRLHTPEQVFALVGELNELVRGHGSRVALEGKTPHITLSDVLQMLHLQRQTGALEIVGQEGRVTICLSSGKIDLALGEGLGAEFRLTRFVRRYFGASKEALDALVAEAHASRLFMGSLLVKRGIISADDLRSVLIRQTEELIYESLRWSPAEFRFVRLMTRPEASAARLGLNMDSVLMEGLRRVDEWHLVEQQIPSLDVVIRLEHGSVKEFDDHQLSKDESAIVRAVDGSKTLRNLMAELDLGSFETVKAAFDLLARQVVRVGSLSSTDQTLG